MSRLQRNLLLAALSLVAAALAGLGAGFFGGGIDETRSVEGERGAVPVAGPLPGEPEGAVNAPTLSPARADVAASPHGSLEVRVVDARGAPLPEAVIRATGPEGGSTLEARGRVLWSELEPGPWKLEVTHPEYPLHRTTVLLAGQDSLRHIVQLDTRLAVHGRVIDRFGRPRAAARLWFLRPGERHPDAPSPGAAPSSTQPVTPSATAQLTTSSDRKGRFRIHLPEAGPWRVSLGPPGNELAAMGRPRELHHGEPYELEVVLGDMTLLEVICTGGPVEGTSARVLHRSDRRNIDSLAGAGAGPPIGFPGEREAVGGSTGDPRGDLSGDLRDGPPNPELPRWITLVRRPLAGDRALFERLPEQEELRLAVQRGDELHESESSFILWSDQRARIEFELPPPDQNAGGGTLPLALRFRSTPLAADERPAGFHWRP